MITLIISLVYLGVALLQYLVAPRVGPNPVLGFKVGHTFASREVWEKSNRFVGKIMLVHALLLFPISLLGDDFMTIFFIAFLTPLILIIPVGLRYASGTLELVGSRKGYGAVERIKPVEVRGFWLWFPLLTYVILLSMMLITYPHLPDTFATHFNAQGNPDSWSSRSSFLTVYSLISLLPVSIAYTMVFLARRHPLFLHPGRMGFKRDAILQMELITMGMMEIMFILIYYGIFLYATRGINYLNIFTIFSIIIVLLPLAWLYTKGRKNGGDEI